MARAALRQVILFAAASGLLLGCVDGAGGPSSGSGTTALTAPAAGPARSGREIEAPDVFQVTDSALWDGRPSLGGIWVASPNVTDPERVVMFNPANGKTVNGALFRRESENPGPPLQVSSDAAEALGMLAGQPTELQVTALRKPVEAAPAVAPPVAVAAATDGATAAPATADKAADTADKTTAAETAALATAALAATDAVTDASPAAADGTAGTTEAAAPEAPKRKTWKERRAEAKAKREAEKAAKAAAAAGAAPAVGTDATAEGAASEPAATADAAAVATVETAPLDARTPDVAAAAGTDAEPAPEPKKKTRRELREEKEAAAAAAAETAAAETPAAEAPQAEGVAARQIQVASFSKEENAKRAVEALAKIGVTAVPQKSEKNGKAVWGVVATGDDALLASIKKAGFADAFYLN